MPPANHSIIIPFLNERSSAPALLEAILPYESERIWVDGGSVDGSAEWLSGRKETVLQSPCGRGAQLRLGAESANGDVLWFLHADCLPPSAATEAISAAILRGAVGGAFTLSYERGLQLGIVSMTANLRTRITGIPFGDQGIFCTRRAYDAAGGFRPLPIMEDVDFASRLRKTGRMVRLPDRIVSSPRRFDRRGILRTVLNDWRCQLAWMAGKSPERIARWYEDPSDPVRGSESPKGP